MNDSTCTLSLPPSLALTLHKRPYGGAVRRSLRPSPLLKTQKAEGTAIAHAAAKCMLRGYNAPTAAWRAMHPITKP
jgi:hypothetical protein